MTCPRGRIRRFFRILLLEIYLIDINVSLFENHKTVPNHSTLLYRVANPDPVGYFFALIKFCRTLFGSCPVQYVHWWGWMCGNVVSEDIHQLQKKIWLASAQFNANLIYFMYSRKIPLQIQSLSTLNNFFLQITKDLMRLKNYIIPILFYIIPYLYYCTT